MLEKLLLRLIADRDRQRKGSELIELAILRDFEKRELEAGAVGRTVRIETS